MNVLNYQFLIYLLVVEMIQIPYIYTYNYVNLLRLFTFTFDLKLLFFNKSVRLFTRDNIFRVINNEGNCIKMKNQLYNSFVCREWQWKSWSWSWIWSQTIIHNMLPTQAWWIDVTYSLAVFRCVNLNLQQNPWWVFFATLI